MSGILWGLGGAWLAWCSFNLGALLSAPLWHRPRGNAYTNGVTIWICPTLSPPALTRGEYRAVWLHEVGHLRRGHAWRNLARRCLFLPTGGERAMAQEFEADDYAHAQGAGLELASALRLLNVYGRTDRYRARRLELLAAFAPCDGS